MTLRPARGDRADCPHRHREAELMICRPIRVEALARARQLRIEAGRRRVRLDRRAGATKAARKHRPGLRPQDAVRGQTGARLKACDRSGELVLVGGRIRRETKQLQEARIIVPPPELAAVDPVRRESVVKLPGFARREPLAGVRTNP